MSYLEAPTGEQNREKDEMRLVKGSGNAAVTIEYTNGGTETWHVPVDESMRVGAWLDNEFGPADEQEDVWDGDTSNA